MAVAQAGCSSSDGSISDDNTFMNMGEGDKCGVRKSRTKPNNLRSQKNTSKVNPVSGGGRFTIGSKKRPLLKGTKMVDMRTKSSKKRCKRWKI